jgi:serine/threonine protein kinase
MGQVYKARDARLNREVAIKVLPDRFANDAARDRFQREARAASALSHPNICDIYDVGAADGQPYLVMELLEGQTLRDRIAGRPLDEETVGRWASRLPTRWMPRIPRASCIAISNRPILRDGPQPRQSSGLRAG